MAEVLSDASSASAPPSPSVYAAAVGTYRRLVGLRSSRCRVSQHRLPRALVRAVLPRRIRRRTTPQRRRDRVLRRARRARSLSRSTSARSRRPRRRSERRLLSWLQFAVVHRRERNLINPALHAGSPILTFLIITVPRGGQCTCSHFPCKKSNCILCLQPSTRTPHGTTHS